MRLAEGCVLLAYAVNGEPLMPEHGFPLRLIIPGYYGTNAVKWLWRIELGERRAAGPFERCGRATRRSACASPAPTGPRAGSRWTKPASLPAW